MVCPVCRDFNAATLTAVNAHIDGCLAQTMKEKRLQMRRSKSKAPKRKRSIAEIFDLEDDEEETKQQQQQPQIETSLNFWPFSEDADEISITVTKFRQLSRRLEALRSNGVGGGILRKSAKSDEGNSNSAEEEEKLEMVCPVCRVFNAETVTAVNAHIDGCLAQAMRAERWQMKRLSSNPKPKAPKKRSIEEILTVAPQIDSAGGGHLAVEVEDKDDVIGEELENSGCGGATINSKKSTNKNVKKKKKMKKVMKKKSKVRKRGVVPLNNESKKMKKKKNKKKKKNSFNNEFTAKEGDAYKRKVQNPANNFRKLEDTMGNKTVKLDDIDASSAHEKKLGLKILSEEKREKVKACDSVGKQQKAVSPIRGILKNHKHISESTSSGCNIQDGTEENDCDVQVPKSDRHVRFSALDYELGPKKTNSFDETVFKLSSNALAASFGKEQSSGSDEGTANLEVNRNDDSIVIDIDKRKEVCPIVESKQFANALREVAVQNFLKPSTNQDKSKHVVEKSESSSNFSFCDNNLHWFDRGNTTTLHCSPYTDVSRPLSAFQTGQFSGIKTQVCKSDAFSSTGKFIDHLEDPIFQSAAMNSNANTRTFLEPSSSYSASYNQGNERPEFPLHTYADNVNNGQDLGGRPWSHMFSADVIDNSFLLPDWGKRSVRNNCMEQNFFGLPLNSHGELINFSSSGQVGMNQPETSCILRDSLSGLPVNNTLHQSSQAQEYLSSGERHVVEKTLQYRVNPFPHYPARLGVTELHGRERADIYQHNSDRCSNHYVQQPDSELNLMRNPFIEQNQRDKVPNHKVNGMVSPKESSGPISPSSSQPTMRLMGKDVPIGRSSKEKQQFARGDLWADEESRRRHYSEDAAKENSLSGRCCKNDWISGSQLQMSTEHGLQSVKIQSNQAFQSTLLMKGPNSAFLNQQRNHVSQNGYLGVSRIASSNLHHITHAPTSCALYNRAPDDLPVQFISGAKPQGLSLQSQELPTPCNFSQPTSSINGELNDRKKHHHATNSAFGFPFLHPVVEEQAKASCFKRSYGSLPPCLLGSTHARLPGTSSTQSFPQNTWGNNFIAPSVNHSADFLNSCNSVTSHCPRKALFCPASIVQPPHVSVTPITKSPSAINSGCRNVIKVTDKVKLDDMTTKDNHPCRNSRKRPASNLVDLTKPNKLPNI
ncbi:uncharacterized protein LOC133316548 [Gastrolobium bilobum]|uniref:uncharacterized protein LOC133316548 n=1 Tax=Gastrolobium bilobum TaxID=150636 RepID=UPI002AB27A6E|nr:uncharacterized protein LOC133316548 [Gastrolobium bilobum]